MSSTLSAFFEAKGVAVLGASTNPKKLSHGIVKNLISHGYKGGVYPVNPNAKELLGLKVYPSIAEVPDPVELAVVVLPVTMIMETMKQVGERGIKAAVVITGGFKELGPEGAEIEKQLKALTDSYGMRIVGPNCVGTIGMYSGLNSTFIKGMPDPGPIAFISQSGALGGGVIDLVVDSHIRFSHFASLGNQMDVNETDMIEYFGDDPNVKVIAVYTEGLQDGARFVKVAREVSRKKPIVFLKAGKNEAGAKAVSSHTGSLAGSYAAYQAALKQAGVLEVQTLSQLFTLSWALGTQPLPANNRVAMTTNAGGAAALAADSLDFHGFRLAEISPEIQERLRTKLNPSAQVSNPVDMLGSVSPEDYKWSLENLNADDGVDVLLPILVPQALVDTPGVANAWVEINKTTQKTLLSILVGKASTQEAEKTLNKAGVPVFTYPDDIGPVLKGMWDYKQYLLSEPFEKVTVDKVDKNKMAAAMKLAGDRKAIGEYESRIMLEAYDIPHVPGDLAKTAKEAVKIADKCGYPVVIKIVAEGLLHKSDAGGIKLNIQNEEELRVAFTGLIDHISNVAPDAKIEGAMVERMAAKGQEVIVGMRRDSTFGPMIMFGMGGTMVELLKDINFKIAPLSRQDIFDMINSTIAGRLMKGFRGSKPADVEAVVDVIMRLSQLSLDNPEIEEIEINPLIVYPEGEGVVALDSRAILK